MGPPASSRKASSVKGTTSPSQKSGAGAGEYREFVVAIDIGPKHNSFHLVKVTPEAVADHKGDGPVRFAETLAVGINDITDWSIQTPWLELPPAIQGLADNGQSGQTPATDEPAKKKKKGNSDETTTGGDTATPAPQKKTKAKSPPSGTLSTAATCDMQYRFMSWVVHLMDNVILPETDKCGPGKACVNLVIEQQMVKSQTNTAMMWFMFGMLNGMLKQLVEGGRLGKGRIVIVRSDNKFDGFNEVGNEKPVAEFNRDGDESLPTLRSEVSRLFGDMWETVGAKFQKEHNAKMLPNSKISIRLSWPKLQSVWVLLQRMNNPAWSCMFGGEQFREYVTAEPIIRNSLINRSAAEDAHVAGTCEWLVSAMETESKRPKKNLDQFNGTETSGRVSISTKVDDVADAANMAAWAIFHITGQSTRDALAPLMPDLGHFIIKPKEIVADELHSAPLVKSLPLKVAGKKKPTLATTLGDGGSTAVARKAGKKARSTPGSQHEEAKDVNVSAAVGKKRSRSSDVQQRRRGESSGKKTTNGKMRGTPTSSVDEDGDEDILDAVIDDDDVEDEEEHESVEDDGDEEEEGDEEEDDE